jgi:hypothetical protein
MIVRTEKEIIDKIEELSIESLATPVDVSSLAGFLARIYV